MRNILVGISGSVAAIKSVELIKKLKTLGNVKVVATKNARYFLSSKEELKKECGVDVYYDEDEWRANYELGDTIPHIELRNWANCFVVAPLSANTLAKISNGICDNLITSIVRAWNWKKPLIICPAMNTYMWDNPITAKQIVEVGNMGGICINPRSAKLACGDTGIGAMESVDKIFDIVKDKLTWRFPLENCNGIPINHHPGAFGFNRRKNRHTGVDLYTKNGEPVYAIEDGTVVHIDYFTGPKLGHTWWNETYGIMVEGASGVINYGEVCNFYGSKIGYKVLKGQLITRVKQVLFDDKFRPDIPGHSTSMLHLELYKHGTRDFADWHDPKKNPDLLDPTPLLILSENRPNNTLTWDNTEEKGVG